MNLDSLNSAADFLTNLQRTLRAAIQAGHPEKGRKLLAEVNAMVDGDGFLELPEGAQMDALENLSGAMLVVTGFKP